MTHNRWEDSAYLRLDRVEYDPRRKEIRVRFRDGDTATIPVTRLVRRDPFALDWSRLVVEEDGYIHVPARPSAGREDADIPAFDMRVLTDAQFAAYLARKAEEAARRVGERLRALRKARGLTAKEVAARAGLAQQTISRIELGQHDVVFSTLEKILAAMGCTLEDILPDEPAETPARVTE
jgi:DNA-binding Xre family transcriptional regulator